MKKLAFFLSLALFASCKIGDDDQVDRQIYGFTETLSLTNVKESYLPGDFMQLEYTPPVNNRFTDTETGESVTVGNAWVNGNIEIFDPFVEETDSIKFSLSVQNGTVTENLDFAKNGEIKYQTGCPAGNDYSLKLLLTFLEPGGYLIFLDREDISIQITFTESSDCNLTDPFNLSDEADIGFLQFNFDVDDTNVASFDTYAENFTDFPAEELAALRAALVEKRAFFVRVEE